MRSVLIIIFGVFESSIRIMFTEGLVFWGHSPMIIEFDFISFRLMKFSIFRRNVNLGRLFSL